jgi:hypothetical protein
MCMTRKTTGPNWLARGLMLLSALLLFAAPAMPSAAAMPQRDCCEEMPCHDEQKKTPCPKACAIACQVVVAPEALIAGSAEIGATPITPMISLLLPGRVLAPELPPPR